MTSIYKPLIKGILIVLTFTASIGFSALSLVKQSQASPNIESEKTNSSYNNSKVQQTYQPLSGYEKKLQSSINKLMPGNKQFNPRFLRHVLISNKK